MNYRIDITDEMLKLGAAEARAWGVKSAHGGWFDKETQRNCARDILQAAAPLIAAQALRGVVEVLGENQMIREGDVKEWLRLRADQIEAGR